MKDPRLVWIRALGALTTVVILAVTGYGLWTAVPESGDTEHRAPDFTLTTTTGESVTLSELRPSPVILYFNEGAGCGSCTMQMAEIEKHAGFAEAGIKVLPIVMNTAEQIQADMDQFGVTTPFLLDDGKVSKAYDVLDKGMHPGLPGHGFVLIDGDGVQRWYGNYPSMWLPPQDLLDEALGRLKS
ncbi:peroxiredoxin family protein [Tessaracoccus sp. MC1865]|uniref:peroxiredoxin family protein n=1 Tax=Tessaracoccus sp. MC1865 TaxID=2760310 RepID=UPI001600186C|nr:peroxiredoxin family protein [Tessaracoccus sp. MC1865]MBB1482333.1 peroxiredoxin family protein [Tessaracoccus sp. MC1865]QTO38199.1 peroxiredoxin family protein [Tessaracoccus sp. MC1865]